MSETSLRSFHILTRATGPSRPETRVDGVLAYEVVDGVMSMHDEDGRMLFMAPLDQIVYIKDLGAQQGATNPYGGGSVTTTTGPGTYTVNMPQPLDAKAIHAALIRLKRDKGTNLGLA